MTARLSKLPWPEIAILLVAILLRFTLLDAKPAHFDEGVNGWFADQMTATGFYAYDPTNYHGPLHMYAVFVSQTLFGREIWALRLPAVLVGILCVGALFLYRDFFGKTASRIAALALAVSPGFVFFSRYSIHESWQVFFSILILWGLLGLWTHGNRAALYAVILSSAGMVLTKETYFIHLACFMLAAMVLWAWQHAIASRPALAIAHQRWTAQDAWGATFLAVFTIVFFYSGTFHDFRLLAGLVETYGAWFHTGIKAGGHEKTTYDILGPLNGYWIMLLARYEWPALLGLLACVRYVAPSDARLRYIAIMAGGTLLAYSLIPYKTPWCVISMAWPFYLIFGSVLVEATTRFRLRSLPWIIALPLLAFSCFQSLRLNFFHATDDREPYVYVQTYPDITQLTSPILQLAKSDPRQFAMAGAILLESVYPLPWILGDFPRVGYYKKDNMPTQWDADFFAIEKSREAELEVHLRRPYFKRHFHLRSAQDECTAYFYQGKFSPVIQGSPEFVPSAP